MVLAIWLYLLFGRGGFWLGRERDGDIPAGGGAWPAVTAVIPARDEAECVGATVASLLRQDYAGEFSVIVVDDQSSDATAQVARDAAAALDATERLTVLSGRALPAGWTGKVWAQQQGIEAASDVPHPPTYLLFTDADIGHARDSLKGLVARAHSGGYVLTSLMAKLRCESLAERMFVPAFIFFFQMLYPFAWSNNPRRTTAAAAGGCMLVRRAALAEAGGMAVIVAPEQLPSAVRINATGRYLGFLVGPLLGAALLLGLGPAYGIFVNALIYTPLLLWLISAPYGNAARGARRAQAPVGRFADIWSTMRVVAQIACCCR